MERSWNVVHFYNDGRAEVVPSTWLETRRCSWPSYNEKRIATAIRKCEIPAASWTQFLVKAIANASFARAKAIEASMREGPESTQKKLDKLPDELTAVVLQYHAVDAEIVVQLFYFMCTSALNTLLWRNELCHWTKGMQIRYNMSHLEQWERDRRLEQTTEVLESIIQAAELLQARKADEDVTSVCEMCNKLTANQIVKIVNLYTPADDFDTPEPVTVIKKIHCKLEQRGENKEQLLMDLMYSYSIRFPFNPSNIRLEDIG